MLVMPSNISATDSDNPSQRTARVLVRNNLFDDVNGPAWGNADGRLFQVLSGANNVAFRHNTGIQSGVIMTGGRIAGQSGLRVHRQHRPPQHLRRLRLQLCGRQRRIAALLPRRHLHATIRRSCRRQAVPRRRIYSNYPGNFSPASMAAVGFVDATNDNYRLSSASPFTGKATDGKDIGVDFAALDAAQSGANAPPPSGSPATPPTPSPTASPSTAYAGSDRAHHLDRQPAVRRDRQWDAGDQRGRLGQRRRGQRRDHDRRGNRRELLRHVGDVQLEYRQRQRRQPHAAVESAGRGAATSACRLKWG